MAKQTFTTGQVLTAAQMTSLQQTAMLGGAASAKTASYTLVAADAGTAISMSNASATTITVNTALFAAGDTVQITNLGAGVCTITAGTATVNTSASLALAQYESGTLDFTSTSAAIFIKGAGAAASGPTGYTLLNSGSTSITGVNEVTFSTLSAKKFLILLDEVSASSTVDVNLRFNGDTSANYSLFGGYIKNTVTFVNGNIDQNSGYSNQTSVSLGRITTAGSMGGAVFVDLTDTTGWKNYIVTTGVYDPSNNGTESFWCQGFYEASAAITSITIRTGSAATFDGSSEIYILGAN